MKKRFKKRPFNPVPISTFLVMICILTLTAGFSAFQQNLTISQINAMIRVRKDIRITSISSSSPVSSATSYDEEYNVSNFTSTLSLPNSNSTITYDVVITNIGTVDMGILDITGLPSNLTYSISNYTLKNTLCADRDSTECNSGSVTTLHITIGYAENGYNSSSTTYNIEMDFDFEQVYTVTYNGFDSVSGLPTQILAGETKSITFTSTTGIPYSVTTTNATGSYSSPTLTLSNTTDNVVISRNYSVTYVDFTGDTSGLSSSISYSGGTIELTSTAGLPVGVTVTGATGTYNSSTHEVTISNITGNITITASYSSGVEIIENPDGSTTTITTTENQDGSTTVTSVTTNTTGDVTSKIETTTNTDNSSTTTTTNYNGDGSSTSTTTNYDSSGSETGHTTSETDTSGNTSTQEVTIVNGNEVVTGYTIETPDDSNLSLNGDTVDTGLIAFDGSSSFEIHISFYATFSSEASYDRVVSVIQDTGTSSSHNYSGFNLFYYYKSSGGGGGNSSSSAKYLRVQSFSGKTALTGQTMSSGNNLYKVDTTITSYISSRTLYDYTISYNGSSHEVTVTSSINGGTSTTQTFTSNVTSLEYATVVIGGNGIDNSENVDTLEVVSFSVTKQ